MLGSTRRVHADPLYINININIAWELAPRSLQSPNSMRCAEEVFGGDCVCGGGGRRALEKGKVALVKNGQA